MADGLFMIRLPMPFRMTHVNIFLFLEQKGFTLIDTGPDLPGVMDALETALSAVGRRLEDCHRIIITHFHMDHCGLAGLIAQRSGAAISICESEYQTILSFSEHNGRIRRMEDFCIRNGFNSTDVDEIASTFLSFQKATSPFNANDFLTDGEILSIGGREIEVVSTPGHTRGHLSFLLPAEHFLIAGDHILPTITPNLSPDLDARDFRPLESFVASLKKVGQLKIERVWPSHGPSFKNVAERITEMIKHHSERTRITFQALDDGAKTTSQVAELIFGNHLPIFDRFLALCESYVHLVALENMAAVSRQNKDGKDFFLQQKDTLQN